MIQNFPDREGILVYCLRLFRQLAESLCMDYYAPLVSGVSTDSDRLP